MAQKNERASSAAIKKKFVIMSLLPAWNFFKVNAKKNVSWCHYSKASLLAITIFIFFL